MTHLDLPYPVPVDIADHLITHHAATGLGVDQVAGVNPYELLAWHEADHRHVAPGYLGHTHTALPAPTSQTRTDPDRAIHAATLKAVTDGRPVPNLAEILDRAAYATVRRAQGKGLSPYDRDCLEIAAAVAERAARRARRRGRNAA